MGSPFIRLAGGDEDDAAVVGGGDAMLAAGVELDEISRVQKNAPSSKRSLDDVAFLRLAVPMVGKRRTGLDLEEEHLSAKGSIDRESADGDAG